MPKKRCTLFFLAASIAVAVWLTSATAVAQQGCESPTRFTTASGWTVTLVNGGPAKDGDLYRYTYRVERSGKGGKIGMQTAPSHFNLAIPNCCPDAIAVLEADHIYEPGAGDPSSKWLSGYFQAFVAKFTSHPNKGEYTFLADTGTTAVTSVCLKVGNKLECGAIEGPACRQPIDSGFLSVIMGPDKFVFQKSDPSLACYDIVQGCPKDTSDDACLATKALVGQDIAGISYKGESATIVTAEGECIVWAQFGTATTRCPIIGGKKYCR